MRILFMSYWGLNDGLTTFTVFSHLQLLQVRPDVTVVRLVTIERGSDAQGALAFKPGFAAGKISFEPLRSRLSGNVILNKIEDFTRFPKELIRQIAGFRPDFVVARGAPAGALAYLVWQKTKLPFTSSRSSPTPTTCASRAFGEPTIPATYFSGTGRSARSSWPWA